MSEEEFTHCPMCGKPIDDPKLMELLYNRKERFGRLDELAQEYSRLLDRFKHKQISAEDYFEKNKTIFTEYLQVLDIILSPKDVA